MIQTDSQPRRERLTDGFLAAGDTLGGFRLEKKLSRGAMGEVWKAYDPAGDRPVVIKVLPPELAHAADEIARVKDTFKRVHALQHEHIGPIYLVQEDPRVGCFLVMKYLDGVTLAEHRTAYVERHGSFPLSEALRLVQGVAEALDYAHAHNVVHRDIKPANIMVCDGGRDVQVVDFGLAADIRTGHAPASAVRMETSGTPSYMAPEQWRGEYQDGRTDQYALAVVAYELLSGRLPFQGADWMTLRRNVLEQPAPELPDLPAHVNRALSKALAKAPTDRYATCATFVKDLDGGARDVAHPYWRAAAIRPPGRPQARAPMALPPLSAPLMKTVLLRRAGAVV